MRARVFPSAAKTRSRLLCPIAAAVVMTIASGAEAAEAPKTDRPWNVVILLADDLGWSDLACQGGDLHRTPELDKLARQCVRFTDAYAAAPVCTPTRASIHTGKYPGAAAHDDVAGIVRSPGQGPQAAGADYRRRFTPRGNHLRRGAPRGRLRHGARGQVALGRCGVLSRDARIRRQHRRHALGRPGDVFLPVFRPGFRRFSLRAASGVRRQGRVPYRPADRRSPARARPRGRPPVLPEPVLARRPHANRGPRRSDRILPRASRART